MEVKDFEKEIKHLNQDEILSIAVSVLNRLLIECGFTTQKELQKRFLKAAQGSKVSKKRK